MVSGDDCLRYSWLQLVQESPGDNISVSSADLATMSNLTLEVEAAPEAATEADLTAEQKLDFLINNANAFFLIVNGIIVFLMQGGFAFLEAGSVR